LTKVIFCDILYLDNLSTNPLGELMNNQLFEPFSFIKNFIDFGLRLILFFWVLFGFRNTRASFLYYELVAGARSGEFVRQIKALNASESELLEISPDRFRAFQRFLNVSTIAILQAKAVKEGQFEIGYLSMINQDKLVSLNEYTSRIRSQIGNGFPLWELTCEDMEAISKVLNNFGNYHKPVSASILFVIQTECLKALGCPIHKWYAQDYYIALFKLVTQISAREPGELLQKEALNAITEKLSNMNIVDNLEEFRILLEAKETCSIGLTLNYIKGDQ
jgi:hypothetical protein